MKNLDSYTLRTVSDYSMPGIKEGKGGSLFSESVTDVTIDPFALHMTTEVAGQTMDTYFTEEGGIF